MVEFLELLFATMLDLCYTFNNHMLLIVCTNHYNIELDLQKCRLCTPFWKIKCAKSLISTLEIFLNLVLSYFEGDFLVTVDHC